MLPTRDEVVAGIFDVGINDRLPLGSTARSWSAKRFRDDGNVRVSRAAGPVIQFAGRKIAYLYGMTFVVCGVITILQSVWLLRLPIVQGPYAGSFAAMLAVGHLQGGGLGAAYGSFFVASLIWCVLTVPIGGWSFIGLFARFLRAPIISGMIVMLDDHPDLERGAAELDWHSCELRISGGESFLREQSRWRS